MGSGQLGRMFAQKAIERGYEVYCYSPEVDSPCARVGVKEFVGEYSDKIKLSNFLNSIDLLTFEFENIPKDTLDIIEEYINKTGIRVSPPINSIRISQNRFKEKNFFNQNGLKTTQYYYLDSLNSLEQIKDKIIFPCILKTNQFGYDGKGQGKFSSYSELENYLKSQPNIDHIIEAIVNFSCEISVVASRFANGKILYFPPSENIHKNHILDFSIHPARISKYLSDKAILATKTLLESLDYEGVLALEFFISGDDVICNEFAPRPHNSGHFSMDASDFSQFELQLLTLCNLEPTISVLNTKPCVMRNIIGFDYQGKEPNYLDRLESIDYKLHLYQKKEAKVGRKMGHWNYLGEKSYSIAFPE
ncbi:MAG: 5-(carboxyamino)imidazole ribonucleotide synthase [Leptospiraceae bacterium]|nr:5-(carboxyamino)imidazole ribonucleotide synthase [Leptospiraceae bacterium]